MEEGMSTLSYPKRRLQAGQPEREGLTQDKSVAPAVQAQCTETPGLGAETEVTLESQRATRRASTGVMVHFVLRASAHLS